MPDPPHELAEAVTVRDKVDVAPVHGRVCVLFRNDVDGAEEWEKTRLAAHSVTILVDEAHPGVERDAVGEGAVAPFRRRTYMR